MATTMSDARPSNPTGTRIRRWWTEEEDEVLCREADYQLAQGSLRDWNRIASKLPGRTNKDCRKRWSKVCKDVRKGAWSQAEDQRLHEAVQKNGFKWTHVAESVGTRHADQCAKRWQHFLDPNLDHSEWLPEDDERLIAAVDKYGRKWKVIGEKEFPGRSATDLKNRHVILERKRSQSSNNSTTSSHGPRESTSSVSSNAPVPDMAMDSGASDFSNRDFDNHSLSTDFNFSDHCSGSVSPTAHSPSGMNTPFGTYPDGTIAPPILAQMKELAGQPMIIPDLDDPNHLYTTAMSEPFGGSMMAQHQQPQHHPHHPVHHMHPATTFTLDGPMDLDSWPTPTGVQPPQLEPTTSASSASSMSTHATDAAVASLQQQQQQQQQQMMNANGLLKQELEAGGSANGSVVNTPTSSVAGLTSADPDQLVQFCSGGLEQRSTLILEDVGSDTVNHIMQMLFNSKTKVKLKLFSQDQ